MKDWTFISNHGLVLLYIARQQQCTTREMAAALKVTERTIHRILVDLEAGGYILRQRTGAGNLYQIVRESRLRNEILRDMAAGDLLQLLDKKEN